MCVCLNANRVAVLLHRNFTFSAWSEEVCVCDVSAGTLCIVEIELCFPSSTERDRETSLNCRWRAILHLFVGLCAKLVSHDASKHTLENPFAYIFDIIVLSFFANRFHKCARFRSRSHSLGSNKPNQVCPLIGVATLQFPQQRSTKRLASNVVSTTSRRRRVSVFPVFV